MSVRSKTPAVDDRTSAQKEADELVARAAETGNWEGFETRELCTIEGAKQLIEFQCTLNRHEVLVPLTKQPFRWQNKIFRLIRCEFANGKAQVELAPPEPELMTEIKKRIEKNRFHYLPYYQGYGFACFPEDYERFKD